MWLELNKFYLTVRGASHGWSMARAHDFFDQVITSSHLLAGITDATMSHGEAWHFARMGLLLERADKTSRILDVKYFILLPAIRDVGTPLDTIQWAALLEVRQRPGNVPQEPRPHHARLGGRFPDPRSAFPPLDSLLPAGG